MLSENNLPGDEQREPGEEKQEDKTEGYAARAVVHGPQAGEAQQEGNEGAEGAAAGEAKSGVSYEEPKRLYRSRTNRMLGGVAGGIAEYLGVDPTLIRLIWILSIFTGIGVIAYIVAWIIVPENPSQEAPVRGEQQATPVSMPGEIGTIIGVVLIGLGLWFLLNTLNVIPAPFFSFLRAVRSAFWPIVLIFIGIIIILATSRRGTITIETQGKRLYRSRRQRMIAGVGGRHRRVFRDRPYMGAPCLGGFNDY